MAAPPTILPPQQRAPAVARVTPRVPAGTDQLQIRISELPAASVINETDQFEISQSGISKRATLELVKESVAPDLRPFLTGIVGGVGITVIGTAPVPTVSMLASGDPGTYGDQQNIPQISVDQFGRVSHVELIPIHVPDVTGFAPLVSPAFTGTPSAPTPPPGNSSTRLATTGFVNAEITARSAPLNSPTFTGTPLAPTPPESDNTTRLATTEFVTRALAAGAAIVVGSSPPASPRSNQLWWHTVFGQLFLFFDDGDSLQWVPASPAVSNIEIAAGTIVDFGGVQAPQGWLLCDGALRNRISDARLFTAIGERWGAGDGSTTFALPDLRGRVTAMIDPNEPGWEELGDEIGEAAHTLTTVEMPSHSHPIIADNFRGSGAWQATIVNGAGANSPIYSLDTTQPAGGNAAHNNVQPTTLINKIIKR